MARLTSQQVRQMMMPVAQFAPAIHAAQEILASVEQAEKDLEWLQKEKTSLEEGNAELKRLEQEYQGRTTKARNDFHAYQDEIERRKVEVEKSFAPLKEQQENLLNLINDIQRQRDEAMANLNEQVSREKKRLDDAKKRFEDFKNQL